MQNFINIIPGVFSKILIILLISPFTSCHHGPTPSPPTEYGMAITQHGITWYFDKVYTYGHFANGDYWVLADPINKDVKIIGIEPKCQEIDGRIVNGAMINPVAGDTHGYDSAARGYTASLNVALNISDAQPLSVPANSSLISMSSLLVLSDPEDPATLTRDGAVLTILSEEPKSGSFRPPYCGNDKTIRFNISQLTPEKYKLFGRLTPVVSVPDLSDIEKSLERPWIDHVGNWISGEIHPENNLPSYGRELTKLMGDAAMMLQLDLEDNQKEKLLIRFLQLGIDNYGVIMNGGRENWVPNGGCDAGRKWPILFTGIILDDKGMREIGSISGDYLYTNGYGPGNAPPDYVYFQEDCSTFYVASDDLALKTKETVYNGKTYYGHWSPKIPVDFEEWADTELGLAEWGLRHSTDPLLDGKDWDAPYRVLNGTSWSGFVLAVRIMESTASAKTLWNHNALFDYMDRFMAVTATEDLTPDWRYTVAGMNVIWATNQYHRKYAPFTNDMWDKYRDDY